jgi:DNA topoisomerase-3
VAYDLHGDAVRVYDLVVRHFLATVSRDALFETTKLSFFGPRSQEVFSASAKKEIDPGFLAIYIRGRKSEEGDEGETPALPAVAEGQSCRIASLKIRAGQTTPPGYLTESELIGLMEKHGVGTDASIPTHINNITVRNYVSLGSGRTLVPTALGVVLVHGYLRIDPGLVLPDVRAAIEQFCDQIAKGSATKEAVIAHSLANFEQKFRYFAAKIEQMDALFEASFSPLAQTGKFLSKCGKCLRYMRFIPLKPQRLYCPACEDTYALPQNGTIKLYKELRCPLDQFELVLFSLGNTAAAQGKSYPLCPYCYSHPPNFKKLAEPEPTSASASSSGSALEAASEPAAVGVDGGEGAATTALPLGKDTAKRKQGEEGEGEGVEEDEPVFDKMGCNACLHPSCKQSAVQNGLVPCPGVSAESGKACGGTLVLDLNSKPHWKLGCSRCNSLIKFHADIHNITPNPRSECTECGYRTATFDFNKLKLPSFLKGQATSYSGCLVCDDHLNSLTELVIGRSMNLQVLRQMQHKRGGGGRRGRGRGRGREGGKDVKMSFSDF